MVKIDCLTGGEGLEIMKKIEIFGAGCARCEQLSDLTRQVADDMGIAYDLVEVREMETILSQGVLMVPALAVDGEVKSSGRIPTRDEIRLILGE